MRENRLARDQRRRNDKAAAGRKRVSALPLYNRL
jgi:hypothetical protein